MSIETYIREMPKVELHVHMEGAIQPETLLALADRHGFSLPAKNAEELRSWYTFRDFDHFIEVYMTISRCICNAEDIELIARDFLKAQAEQNIVYSEVTFTADTHYRNGIAFADQMAALERANAWAKQELGVFMGIVLDIPRQIQAEEGQRTADWVLERCGKGLVVALGLGGPEVGHPPEKFVEAFKPVLAAGLPSVPHAGETEGPQSIWGSLRSLGACRIGHGVRCLEDPELVAELRRRQIPLEVSPTSNVCLKVVSDFASHPLPRLMEEGLYVTLNSDDPAMFNTNLVNEMLMCARYFKFEAEQFEKLEQAALQASLLPEAEKKALAERFQVNFKDLRKKHL